MEIELDLSVDQLTLRDIPDGITVAQLDGIMPLVLDPADIEPPRRRRNKSKAAKKKKASTKRSR